MAPRRTRETCQPVGEHGVVVIAGGGAEQRDRVVRVERLPRLEDALQVPAAAFGDLVR
jgi:hypothetical protein